MKPTIHQIRRRAGVAGQFAVTATVEYPDEPRRTVEFVGDVYGGPVLMRTGQVETFVTDPGRFGEKFGPDWVRRFIEDDGW